MDRMRTLLAIAALVGTLVLGASPVAVAQEAAEAAPAMLDDFNAGLARAAAEHKPLFVVFDHPW